MISTHSIRLKMEKMFSARTLVDIAKVVRGMRNGFYYAARVRLMHSIVIAILFMKGSLPQRIKRILALALEHGIRISVFVGVYKTICILLKRFQGASNPFHSLIAGALGAFIMNIDGESAIGQQVTFYVLSRSIMGGVKVLQDKGILPPFNANRFLSVIGWGLVMTLFFDDKTTLQPSLQQSMTYLYDESEQVTDWVELVPFEIPEKLKIWLEKTFPALKEIKKRYVDSQYRTIHQEREFTA